MYPTMAARPSMSSGVVFSLESAMAISPHRLAEGRRAYVGRVCLGIGRPDAEGRDRAILLDNGLSRNRHHAIDPGRRLQLAQEPGIRLNVDRPAVELERERRALGHAVGGGVG